MGPSAYLGGPRLWLGGRGSRRQLEGSGEHRSCPEADTDVLELLGEAPSVCRSFGSNRLCGQANGYSPSGRAGLCGSGMQLGAEAKPPHTVSHGAKEVQGPLLQKRGGQRPGESCPASSIV